MEDNIHPVVRLLAKRMESHPEEFGPDSGGRWAAWLDQLIPFVTEEERVMLRGPMMQDIHEEVMDELLNGDERRAKESRIRREAEERQMQSYVQQQRAYLQQAAQPGSFVELNNVDWGRQNNLLQNNPGVLASMKKALGL